MFKLSGLFLSGVFVAFSASAADFVTFYSRDPDVATFGLPQTANTLPRALADQLFGITIQQYGVAANQPLVWRLDGQTATKIAATGVDVDAGPKRNGAESADIFYTYNTTESVMPLDTDANGRVVFVGRAGPADLGRVASTRGVWLNDASGNGNREIARELRDDLLGPGLGAGVFFDDIDDFMPVLRLGQGGRLAAVTRVGSGSVFASTVLTHNGTDWDACTRIGSTDAGLRPNLPDAAAVTFRDGSSKTEFAIGGAGELYAGLYTSEFRWGLWRVCGGAPVPLAYEERTGSLGPGLGATSTFTDFDPTSLTPIAENALYFKAIARNATGAIARRGLFRHQSGSNTAIAYGNETGTLGPQIPNFVFSTFEAAFGNKQVLSSRGDWLAFIAQVDGPSGSRYALFRYHPSLGIQPLGFVNATGALGLPNNRVWKAFNGLFINALGHVVVHGAAGVADTASTRGEMWLLRGPGVTPQPILLPGDSVRYYGANDLTLRSATVTTVNAPLVVDAPGYQSGRDSWINAEGDAVLSVNISGDTNPYFIRGQAFNPDALLVDGFE